MTILALIRDEDIYLLVWADNDSVERDAGWMSMGVGGLIIGLVSYFSHDDQLCIHAETHTAFCCDSVVVHTGISMVLSRVIRPRPRTVNIGFLPACGNIFA